MQINPYKKIFFKEKRAHTCVYENFFVILQRFFSMGFYGQKNYSFFSIYF
jgi:hypothetical protein